MIMKRIRKSTNFKYILVSETAKLDFKWVQLQIYNVYILSGHCKITILIDTNIAKVIRGIAYITFWYFTYHIAVISHKNKNFSLKNLKKMVHFQNLLYF